jgi:hypothetical protein
MDPPVEVPEGLRPQGVQTPLTLGADPNEAPVVEYAKVTGYSGLADGEGRDERAHRPLAAAELLNNPEPGRVRQYLERQSRRRHGRSICLHIYK